MEYITSAEQEQRFHARHQERLYTEQDRLRNLRDRASPHQGRTGIQEEDRRFFVEADGTVYLGEVNPGAECPLVLSEGGAMYTVDPLFLREVDGFVRRNPRYMIVFHMRKGYSRRAGVYPARMVAEGEELFLEDVCYS